MHLLRDVRRGMPDAAGKRTLVLVLEILPDTFQYYVTVMHTDGTIEERSPWNTSHDEVVVW